MITIAGQSQKNAVLAVLLSKLQHVITARFRTNIRNYSVTVRDGESLVIHHAEFYSNIPKT